MGAMVSYMVKETEITKEDISELRALLQDLKQEDSDEKTI